MKFVLHPRWKEDRLWLHFKNFRKDSGYIQLKRYMKGAFPTRDTREWRRIENYELEPEVPFEPIRCSEYYAEQPFTHIFLSHSPGYTPQAADSLIPIIKEYICEL